MRKTYEKICMIERFNIINFTALNDIIIYELYSE